MKLTDLTLEEKIKLLVGSEEVYMNTASLGGKVYSIKTSDGPSGPHFSKPLLWLPSITSLCSTWNIDIVRDYVDALSDICVINEVDMLLGPAVNIKRLATCGRNFEYFSEDPFLTGIMAREYVRTLQNRGIGATVKHYCCNNREYARLYASSNLSVRALREIYTKSFEMICEAKPWSIMCSYNAYNGIYLAENKYLLTDVLRNELHFDGLIMSDWGAVHDLGKAIKAGLDLAMPYQGVEHSEEVKKALINNEISEKVINRALENLETLINKIQLNKKNRFVKFNDKQRHEIAVKTVEEGIVLLKNEDNILPLQKNKRVLIVGEQQEFPELNGGGSCNLADDPEMPFDKDYDIKLASVDKLLSEYRNDLDISYVAGYHCYKGFGLRYGNLHSPVVTKRAKEYDVAIVFVGTNRALECEGFDREDLNIPKIQLDVLNEVINNNKNVIVVIEAGSVINVSSFEDKVKAIVYTGFGGEGINEALAKVLSGEVSPSGKLIESFISSIDDNPYLKGSENFANDDYKDDILVGYRLYEKAGIKVNYPFGHGLSYSSFIYDNLFVKEDNGQIKVQFSIKNNGQVKAKEVAQLYIHLANGKVEHPVKELKGFQKVELNPNEERMITINLPQTELRYFDENKNSWAYDDAQVELLVGSSSSDIRLRKVLN